MSSEKDLDELIYLECLINAQSFGGNPNPKAVLGKLMQAKPDLRSNAKEVLQKVNSIIDERFPMELSKILSEIEKIDPAAMEKKAKLKEEQKRKTEERKRTLEELPNAKVGQFVVRYAPDPSKYPHLGHAINYRINRMYADKYKGIAVLRFDDTNPLKVKPEYYEAIKEGLEWADAKWDKEVRASDYMDEFYRVAKELIMKGEFYVCTCTGEQVHKYREEKKECDCRKRGGDESLFLFEQMVGGELPENSAVVRLKGDMDSDNSVMRDPIMLRILHAQHPLHTKMHFVWPLYDFESAYMDYKIGTTHIIRSSEFGTMREELQSHLIALFGGNVPTFFSYGRYNIVGCPTKGRVIRELVEKGVVHGWDDIRLVTIQGLKKRGIQSAVLTDLIREKGTTPKSTTVEWSDIVKFNRIALTPISRHFFGVRSPLKLTVEDAPDQTVELPYFPEKTDKGHRTIKTGKKFLLDFGDMNLLKVGRTIRLKDLHNVAIIKIDKKSNEILGKLSDDQSITSTIPKLQWVPAENAIAGELTVPYLLEPKKGEINENSLEKVPIWFENNIDSVQEGEIMKL